MSAPKLSLRSEMSSRNSTNVSDIRKQSLFGIMDKDGTGTIDKAEFDKLYDVIEKETAQHLADQLAMQERQERHLRRVKVLACVSFVLLGFLMLSASSNFALTLLAVDSQMKTTTDASGAMTVKGGDSIVKTAVATEDIPMIAAPVLDFETLAAVKSLKVKYGEADRQRVLRRRTPR